MFLRQIFDETLAQYSYLIGCQRTGEAIVIDPERDIDRYLEIAEANGLRISAVTETHIHADFVSGSRQFVETRPGVTAYLSDMGDADWKYRWAEGRADVKLLRNGDHIFVGNIQITAVHTPGHTPEHLSFLIEDHGAGADEPMAIATGDFVFVGDVGRPDLLESAAGQAGAMEPSARTLFRSLFEFAKLPEFLQVLPGHGAGSACGKALGAVPTSTVGYEKRFNSALITAVEFGEEAFVESILAGQPEPPVYFARMKQVNKLGPDVLASLPRPLKLDVADVSRLTNDVNAVFLDARSNRNEFMDRHLLGSLFAPAGATFSVVAGSYVEPDQDIYLLLSNQQLLDESVRQLIRIGLDRIKGYALVEEILLSPDLADSLTSTEWEHVSNLDTLIAKHPGATVLDVRGAGEHAAGHVPGSLNVAHTRLAKHHEFLGDKKLLVHCAQGGRGACASAYLERQGFDVTFCDGPFESWLGDRSTLAAA